MLFVVHVCKWSYDGKLNCLVVFFFVFAGKMWTFVLLSQLSENSYTAQVMSNSKFFTLHFFFFTILEQSFGLSVSLSTHNGLVIITCWSLFVCQMTVWDHCVFFLKLLSTNSIWLCQHKIAFATHCACVIWHFLEWNRMLKGKSVGWNLILSILNCENVPEWIEVIRKWLVSSCQLKFQSKDYAEILQEEVYWTLNVVLTSLGSLKQLVWSLKVI